MAVNAFGAAVVVMFGLSSLYHRGNWSNMPRRWLHTLDHAGIFILISGTYTAFGLLVLEGPWRSSCSDRVGAACAVSSTRMEVIAAVADGVVAIGLGWVGALVAPQIAGISAPAARRVVVGGLAFTVGAVIFATRRPNPYPATFGYHEIFHLLVIAASRATRRRGFFAVS